MYRSGSNEGCQCKNKSRQNFSNMQVKYQCEKLCDSKFKNVKTQTEINTDLKAQEQIAELLTEIAVTINQKTQLEDEITKLQNTITKNEEIYNLEKLRTEEEMTKLTEANLEKDAALCNLKISHLEEQKALLSQINELKTDLHIIKEEREQSQHNMETSTAVLEHKLNTALTELKAEQEKNTLYLSKLNKYKIKVRYLTKYIKQLIEEVNTSRLKQDQGDASDFKDKSYGLEGSRQRSLSHENLHCRQKVKKFQPDIENMILSELFFKPNPVPIDVASLFFCSTDGSQS